MSEQDINILDELKRLNAKITALSSRVEELEKRLDIKDEDEEHELWAERERRERGV